MAPGSRRLDERLEDLMQQVFAAGRRRLAWHRARRLLHDKQYLRGHACHCPPGAPVHLVHSEGLREGADVVVDYGSNVGSPHRHQLPVQALARVAREIGNGDVVHVKSELLPAFVEHVLPGLGGPIVLVTGDSDFAPVARLRHLLEDPRIIHWFAQNCDIADRHPRLTRIPIGIDNPHYSKLDKRVGFALAMLGGKNDFDWSLSRNDMGDQQLLQKIMAEARTPFADKPARALCTFHMNQKFMPNIAGVPDRVQAYEALRDAPFCHFVERRLAQEACWRMHEQFAFEVSPRGNGLDCFRTWEALALGTVPIVKTTTLDALYIDEGLPVVIVRSFDEVTQDALDQWKARYRDSFAPPLLRKLSNGYWLDKIRSASNAWKAQA